MADPVIRAAFKLPAASAAVAAAAAAVAAVAPVDRLGRCRDSITLDAAVLFSTASLYRDRA